MESFYGGHAGVSFVLREAFPSRDAMVAAFKQGRNYTDVWFGEYCIIATPNLNDRENGEVYRRGVNYGAPLGGAEYIGQFVGPQSGTAYFEVEPLGEMQSEFDAEASALFSAAGVANQTTVDAYPDSYEKQYHYLAEISEDSKVQVYSSSTDTTGTSVTPSDSKDIITAYGDGKIGQTTVVERSTDSTGSPIVNNTTYARYGSSDDSTTEPIMRKKTVNGGSDYVKPYVAQFTPSGGLVSGKTHNSIDVSWFNVRANSPESDSYIKVGLQIPYNVFNFAAKSVSPYDSNGKLKPATGSTEAAGKKLFTVYQDAAQQKSMLTKPFYQQWTIENAKGIKGDSFHDLRIEKYSILIQTNVEEANAVNWLVSTDSAQNFSDGKYTTVYDTDLITTKKNNSGKYFYDTSTTKYNYNYIVNDQDASATYYTKFAGDFHTNCRYIVDLNNVDSESTKSDLTKKALSFNSSYKYIPNVEVMVADLYVYDEVQKPVAIPIFIGFIKQIGSIDFNSTTGNLTITYTNGATKTFVLAYVDSVALDSDDGQFSYKKLNGTTTPTTVDGARLQWVKDLVVADDGKIYLSKTTNSASINVTVNGSKVTVPRAEYTNQRVRWIDEIIQTKNDNGEIVDDGIIDIKYNTKNNKGENEHEEFGINYPKNIELSDDIDDSKLLKVTYTDPEIEGTVKKTGTIGDPINSIADSFVGEDWYLYILYTAPERRPVYNAHGEYDQLLNGSSTQTPENRTMTVLYDSKDKLAPYSFVYRTLEGAQNEVSYTAVTENSTADYKLEYSKLPYIVNKNWCIDPVDVVGSRTVGNSVPVSNDLTKWSGKNLFWQKIGPIRDDSGPYLGYHLTNRRIALREPEAYAETWYDGAAAVYEHVPNSETDRFTTTEIVDFLNEKFKNGLTSENIAKDVEEPVPPESKYEGKMIYYTPGTTRSANKDGENQTTAWLFQYDYSYYVNDPQHPENWKTGGWEYVGQLGSATNNNTTMLYRKTDEFKNIVNKLDPNGFAFYAQSVMQTGGWYDSSELKYHGTLTNIWEPTNTTKDVFTVNTNTAIENY